MPVGVVCECGKRGMEDQDMVDHRSTLAKARDAFLESEEGQELCKGQTHGLYLENRIIHAFIAGWEAAKKDMEDNP